jgi:hypothetical protein
MNSRPVGGRGSGTQVSPHRHGQSISQSNLYVLAWNSVYVVRVFDCQRLHVRRLPQQWHTTDQLNCKYVQRVKYMCMHNAKLIKAYS